MSTPTCRICGGSTKTYDRVKRILKGPRGSVEWKYIYRSKCTSCGHIQRELPEYMLPFKHYSKDIIEGVVEGLITEDTIGFEDYPCHMTMIRWSRSFHVVLRR